MRKYPSRWWRAQWRVVPLALSMFVASVTAKANGVILHSLPIPKSAGCGGLLEYSSQWTITLNSLPELARKHAPAVLTDRSGKIRGLDFSDHREAFFEYVRAGGQLEFSLAGFDALRLRGNLLHPEDGHLLARWPGLRVLDVSQNSLNGMGAANLARSKTLVQLEMPHNSVGAIGAASLGQNRRLRVLNLAYNRVGDSGASILGEFGELRHLSLRGNRLKNWSGIALGLNRKLTHLDVGDNELGEDGARGLSATENLTHLNITGNAIGSAGVRVLKRVESLTHLSTGEGEISLPSYGVWEDFIEED